MIPRHQSFVVKCGTKLVSIGCLIGRHGSDRSVTISCGDFSLVGQLCHHLVADEDIFAVTSFDMFWATVYPEGCWEWVVDQDEITAASAVLRVADQWIEGRRPRGYIGK